MSQSTLHPHVCGRCESAVPPFCSALTGSRCRCPEPSSPTPVSNGNICFYTLGVTLPEPGEPVSLAPALDSVETMRLAMGATPTELSGELIVEARERLLEARKIADRHRETDPFASDLYRRLCDLTSDVDDLLAWVAERSAR